ncbi:MAG TPA: MBL fold metallo-hydrolase [Pyrinomonadaceae bacterium]|nr:MBL fold metallo-hydrolase [Pyrinomonadaceae bacterium]
MSITEIAPDVFRLSLYIPEANLQFNQFLVRDDEPLLFHTGMRGIFPAVREAVAKLIDPATLRHISFSHFEADECGSLNDWLAIAPNAEAVCSFVGAEVSVNDFASRPARGLMDGETFSTGKYDFRLLHTPHLPHCWEAGLLFEETNRTLFSSDLFHQLGDVESMTDKSVIDRVRQTFLEYDATPFAGYMPYTRQTETNLQKLIDLEPATIAAMHGSTFKGDGAKALREFGEVMRDVL